MTTDAARPSAAPPSAARPSAAPPSRPSSRRKALVVVILALLAAAAGGAWWWTATAPAREASALALRVERVLESGDALPDTFHLDEESVQTQLDSILRGLRPLRPDVTVNQVLATSEGRGSIAYTLTWTIHAGKPVWTTSTSVPLRLTEAGWRAEWSPTALHRSLRDGDWLRAARLAPQRGEVIGADDRRLVFRHAVQRVGIDLTLVDRATARESARRMADSLDIAPDPFVARVDAATDSAFVEAAVLRVGDPGQRALTDAVRDLPGFRAVLDEQMRALTPTFARPLLGTVGEATAEIVDRSGGEVRAGDVVGLSGLHAAQDSTLRGVTGFVVEVIDPDGTVSEELFRVDAIPGRAVHLALDADVQLRADAAVASVAEPSAVVVLRPSDGHVLAAASGPGGAGASTATRARLDLGPAPPGLSFAVAPLAWGEDAEFGVPVFLGELSDAVSASPVGVAGAAASAAAGVAVVPRILTDGPSPTRLPLSDADVAALRSLVTAADDRPGWEIRTDADLIVVAFCDGCDADALVTRLG